jgi:hypothetical protein
MPSSVTSASAPRRPSPPRTSLRIPGWLDVVGMVLVDTDPTDYRSEGNPFVPDDVREKSYWASENLEKLDLDATLDLVREESTPESFDAHPLVILTPSVPNSGNIGEGGSPGLPGPRVGGAGRPVSPARGGDDEPFLRFPHRVDR